MNFFGKTRAQVNRSRMLFQEMIDEYLNNDQGLPDQNIANIFKYEKVLQAQKNSFVHVMSLRQEPTFKFLVKTARNKDADNLLREFQVQKHLNALHDRTPNFPVALGLFNCYTRTNNQGALVSTVCETPNKNINTSMLVMEYIPDSQTYSDFILDVTTTNDQKYEIFLQVYYTLWIGQYFQNFTHYDLHLKNILVRKIQRSTLKYIVPDTNNPTREIDTDVLATIIDFGQAYSAVISPDMSDLARIYEGPLGNERIKYDTKFYDDKMDFKKILYYLSKLHQKPYRLYHVLGIDFKNKTPDEIKETVNGVTQNEIRSAYRKLSKIYHQDRFDQNQYPTYARTAFLRVQQAYDVLSDKITRKIYDTNGEMNRREVAPNNDDNTTDFEMKIIEDETWLGQKLYNFANRLYLAKNFDFSTFVV